MEFYIAHLEESMPCRETNSIASQRRTPFSWRTLQSVHRITESKNVVLAINDEHDKS
jgi:hypothetical protein